MNWFFDNLGNLNYVGIVASMIFAAIFSAFWFNPGVFGERWRKSVGLSAKDMKDTSGYLPMVIHSLVLNGLAAVMIAALLDKINVTSLVDGLLSGGLIGLLLTGVPIWDNNLYARKDTTHSFILMGYRIIIFAVTGALVVAL